MKQIKVLGSGCRSCELTARLLEEEARSLGVDMALEKVTDMAEIMGYGVLSTPGVVVDGKVVHSGGVPRHQAVRDWLLAP